MNALTLPGDIPGLIRKGSPVVATIGNLPDQRGVYVMRDTDRADRACVVVEDLPGYGQIIAWPLIAGTALDLTDATGRAHAAWWLAKSTAGVWRSVDGYVWTDGDRLYDEVDVPALRAVMGQEAHCRALPDGSMWRDAEALRLACLHVAGRAP